ncbi:GNAT family N-acetyltransferase [Cytobacillus sp. Sa5YUA1]|uniref:GNAT family N-acetyltransferase n=1 Tax=Cytobacillus stercorigallinarum TaxID=2762240 RepID=A0ABR8QSE3_9BACI|nr:GNAT family N-acetyltransferase [Cytobacillus stercorigallinarum]MBD7938324.1 GNAT family N-acetyltransferase [Cytobacillus stercorigallinarum]
MIEMINENNRERVSDFFSKHWGTTEMVLSSGVYHCDELDGYVYKGTKGEIVGLVTYIRHNEEIYEVISLDSVDEGQGIGSSLMFVIEEKARGFGAKAVQLITTNDNLHALSFYQKRGYVLKSLYPNAVEIARTIKPSIPFVASNGIPIRDELLLYKQLS